MEEIKELVLPVISLLIFIIIWFVIRRILKSVSDKINNAEVYKEDMLNILEEIRDELKQLNQNNTLK